MSFPPVDLAVSRAPLPIAHATAYDPDGAEAARLMRRQMAIAGGHKDYPIALTPPGNAIAHAYARPIARRDQVGGRWSLAVPECPYCGGGHAHTVETSSPLELPFDPATRVGGVTRPPCSPWSFWRRYRATDRTEPDAGRRSVSLPDYKVVVDLAPERGEWALHLFDPAIAAALAVMLDEMEAYGLAAQERRLMAAGGGA